MSTVILVIHLIVAVSLVAVVLLQQSEGGALGMGGGGMSGFMTGRSTANLLTRTTAILAGVFFVTSIALAIIATNARAPTSIIDAPANQAPLPTLPQSQGLPPVGVPPAGSPPASSAPAPSTPAPAPSQPAEPSAPLAK